MADPQQPQTGSIEMLGDINDQLESDVAFLSATDSNQWQMEKLMFISTTQTDAQHTDAHIDDKWEGYFSSGEIEKLGDSILLQSTTNIFKDNYSSITAPLPDKLRCLTDYSFLRNAKKVKLLSLYFWAYESLLPGSTNQNADVYTAINTANGTTYSKYATTSHMNTIPIPWLNNFFRPSCRINGDYEVLGANNKSAYGNKNNRGDLSIGEPLPAFFPRYKDLPGPVNDIEVRGGVGQIVKVATDYYLRRLILACKVTVLYQ